MKAQYYDVEKIEEANISLSKSISYIDDVQLKLNSLYLEINEELIGLKGLNQFENALDILSTINSHLKTLKERESRLLAFANEVSGIINEVEDDNTKRIEALIEKNSYVASYIQGVASPNYQLGVEEAAGTSSAQKLANDYNLSLTNRVVETGDVKKELKDKYQYKSVKGIDYESK